MGLFSMQHHPHHQPQGPAPTQHLQHQQHPRPSSIVHQQHHPQAQSQQHPSYASGHPIAPAYQQTSQATNNQHSQEGLPYYAHPSPYSTPGATSGYTSADQSDMMAAAQMPRPPYPPMSYHTPQSNSPASVASPSQHDQHRSIYGQPPSQPLQQHMYYQTQQAHYPSMQAQPQQSPYAQHAAQTHQPMSSQTNMMMSAQTQQQQQMPQHPTQHTQAQMTNSPRGHMKTEPQVPLQLQKPQSTPMQHAQHPQNGAALNTPTGSTPGGVNPNAAPGPIPATTPLVVRQDQNGVQWIAFEYSRDRVKMEYTIRCDVESVNTDELSAEFKTENCVYPRACCPKDQYRGNRQVYETECNTVGWALAQLNPPLRGKRGLIQRAVDSWRNSNQDPRLRSRRVRRMAKMNTRKSVQGGPHPGGHMGGPSPPGMPQGAGGMGPAGASTKMPGMNMGHMPHANAPGGGDEVGMFHQM
nr:ribosomal protein l24e [Colletotrichum truncatum]KAF6800424.1 ribosomal protein l24e [Colletotrichum truncatum]